MPDQTAASLTLHSCLPHRVRAVRAVLEQHDFIDSTDDQGRVSVTLGVPYTVSESFPVGDSAAVSRALMEAAPEVSFTVYEEPAYDWLGEIFVYVPHLGVFPASCDNSGTPLLPQPYLLNIEDQEPAERQMRLGMPWLDAIKAMPGGIVTEPDSFAVHCIPHHNEFVVIGCKQGASDLRFSARMADRLPTADLPASDGVLAEWNFRRFRDWTPLDETSQLWRTDVYKLHP